MSSLSINLNERCDDSLPELLCTIGNVSGWFSSFIWFIVLFPQLLENFKEKSVEGISLLWALLNFSASYVNIFFVFQNSLPLFGKISAIYMPSLEFLLLIQFYAFAKYEVKIKNTYFYVFLFFISCLTIINIFLSKFYIDYLEWISIVLWSIETLPQVYLNFKNKSTQGLSKLTQAIVFFGKTTDMMQNYFLKIPIQYRYLAFFSSSAAYVGNIQVLYFENEKKEFFPAVPAYNEDEFEPARIELNGENHPSKHKLSIKTILIISVFFLLMITGAGFILRTENYFLSILLLLGFYTVISLCYIFS
jgi:hypothetical protein